MIGKFLTGKRRVKDLLLQKDNRFCADCNAPDPKWAKCIHHCTFFVMCVWFMVMVTDYNTQNWSLSVDYFLGRIYKASL